jgi:arginase/N-omega-hydroxy-L-arginine amidinohydrolase
LDFCWSEKVALNDVSLTVFQARAGDHNNLAFPAAKALGEVLSVRFGLDITTIGTPEPALNSDWSIELKAALPALRQMQRRYQDIFARGHAPLTVLTRCAVALSTLPVVGTFRPDTKVIWCDAHADLNTPDVTPTGYLGGLALSGPAGLWNSGLGCGVDLANVILLGCRDLDAYEVELIEAGKVRLVPPEPGAGDKLKDLIGGSPVYFHLDCDVLNPGIVPTDYVHDGGFSLAEMTRLAAVLAESEIVGCEIAELQMSWKEGGEAVSPLPLLDALQPIFDRLLQKPDFHDRPPVRQFAAM